MEANGTGAKADTSPAKKRTNVVKVLHWGDTPPVVVCLCGASKFKSEFLTANRALTLQGHIVLLPGMFDNADGGFVGTETKKKLEELQFRKIEMADIIYVINPSGYLNEATKREIDYAESLGKFVKYLTS